jgi:hypothetical protein
MIGLVFALVGLACIVYSMFIVAAAFVGLFAIAWTLLSAAGRQLLRRFDQPRKLVAQRAHSREGQPRTRRPLLRAISTTIAETSGGMQGRSPSAPNIGNDITIIAGDQAPGKALYSELDSPPQSKLAEN